MKTSLAAALAAGLLFAGAAEAKSHHGKAQDAQAAVSSGATAGLARKKTPAGDPLASALKIGGGKKLANAQDLGSSIAGPKYPDPLGASLRIGGGGKPASSHTNFRSGAVGGRTGSLYGD